MKKLKDIIYLIKFWFHQLYCSFCREMKCNICGKKEKDSNGGLYEVINDVLHFNCLDCAKKYGINNVGG